MKFCPRRFFGITGEEELVCAIEALRSRLEKQAGGEYNPQKIQAAYEKSAQLDKLVCKWLQTKKKK